MSRRDPGYVDGFETALRLAVPGPSDGRIRDRLGRKIPHRLDVLSFANGIPGFIERFDVSVPGEFWSQDVDDDGRALAVVACPCGNTPKIIAGRLATCANEGCPRVFAFTGQAVLVSGTPPRERPVVVPDAAEDPTI